ncbi:DUF4124 domain-containing protein [Kaarinaea lacus]
MHSKHRLILATAIIFLFVAILPSQAAVYKHVDEQGNVSYSDVPSKKDEKPVKVEEPMTFTPDPATRSSSSSETEKKPAEKPVEYQSLSIISPANDAAVRSNSGDVTIQLSLAPELQRKHYIIVILDGAKVHEGSSTSVTLTNLDRGTHTISAQVQDAREKTLLASDPISFHLQRAAVGRPTAGPR